MNLCANFNIRSNKSAHVTKALIIVIPAAAPLLGHVGCCGAIQSIRCTDSAIPVPTCFYCLVTEEICTGPIWDWFGEDRLLFGSDWPNGDTMAPYADTLAIISRICCAKGIGCDRKVLLENSTVIYRWSPRSEPPACLEIRFAVSRCGCLLFAAEISSLAEIEPPNRGLA